MSVMALLGKDGRDPIAPRRLDRGEDGGLIVDEHVTSGGMPALDVREFSFLVDLDQHFAVESMPQT